MRYGSSRPLSSVECARLHVYKNVCVYVRVAAPGPACACPRDLGVGFLREWLRWQHGDPTNPMVGTLTGTITISSVAGDFGWGIPVATALKGANLMETRIGPRCSATKREPRW